MSFRSFVLDRYRFPVESRTTGQCWMKNNGSDWGFVLTRFPDHIKQHVYRISNIKHSIQMRWHQWHVSTTSGGLKQTRRIIAVFPFLSSTFNQPLTERFRLGWTNNQHCRVECILLIRVVELCYNVVCTVVKLGHRYSDILLFFYLNTQILSGQWAL